ncbi:MAG: hypothetical protein IJU91_04870 [Selenomonadaceae bacterium]|nr:hypothetical protein [Selenomonadaceae bacterium]
MEYRPRWERIMFLAFIFNVVVMFALAMNWKFTEPKEDVEDLQEVAWVDSANVEEVPPPSLPLEIQTFPEIKLPPLEIPKFEPLPPPEPVEVEKVEKPVEPPKETAPPAESEKPAESKPAENEKPAEPKPQEKNEPNQLKAIVKVYPKDLIDQLVASGAVKERVTLNSGKVVLAVTIGTDGKVKNVEIRRGGGTDERGNIINLMSEVAASSWIFEPYLDEEGKPKELKTQIEFKPEDF